MKSGKVKVDAMLEEGILEEGRVWRKEGFGGREGNYLEMGNLTTVFVAPYTKPGTDVCRFQFFHCVLYFTSLRWLDVGKN